MKCLDCGVYEGEGDCVSCQAIAAEIGANTEALRGMRDEPLPLFIVAKQPRPHPAWWIGLAAALLAAVSVPVLMKLDRQTARSHHLSQPEPLKVKMLTSDPDVVIFWLIDAPEGVSR